MQDRWFRINVGHVMRAAQNKWAVFMRNYIIFMGFLIFNDLALSVFISLG